MELYIFNEINKNEIIKSLLKFKMTKELDMYFQAARGLIKFSQSRAVTSDTITEFVLQTVLQCEDVLEISGLADYVKHDIKTICNEIIFYDWDALFSKEGVLSVSHISPLNDTEKGLTRYIQSLKKMIGISDEGKMINAILDHYNRFGFGKMAAYSALKWTNGKFVGVSNVDPVTFDNLTGLESQKKTLIENTEGFLRGKKANNILLVGGVGTGKSSSVKACLNRFKDQGLRLIEVSKESISDLPFVISSIKDIKRKYIIFIDDLSFEPEDFSYKQLKVALDGQVERTNDNILIYATSNRRHLVRETWLDRNTEATEDIHKNDTVNEKMSLSTRFGIVLHFISPNQEEYIAMVRNTLAENGVDMTAEIKSKALTWAISYNGRSGRTAKQFVTSYMANNPN